MSFLQAKVGDFWLTIYKIQEKKQLVTLVLVLLTGQLTIDFCFLRAALTATSKLYDSVDDALHRLVRVSNQRGRDLEALGRLARLVDKLEKVSEEGRRQGWLNTAGSHAFSFAFLNPVNKRSQFKNYKN